MRPFLIVLFVATVCYLPPSSVKAEPHLEVTLTPPRTAKMGQSCHLVIQVSWKSVEGDYRFTQPELMLENLAVEEAGESNETFLKDEEEWKGKVFRYRLKCLRTGEGKVRPFRINYVNSRTAQGGQFEVDSLQIRIVPERAVFYRVVLIAFALMSAGGGLAVWVLFKNPTRSDSIQRPEVALEDQYLSHLKGVTVQLPEATRFFRSYLSEKYSLTQGGATNREIIALMEGKVSPNELKTLKEIFDKLEQCLFGHEVSPRDAQRQLCREMIHFVEGKKII